MPNHEVDYTTYGSTRLSDKHRSISKAGEVSTMRSDRKALAQAPTIALACQTTEDRLAPAINFDLSGGLLTFAKKPHLDSF